MILIMQGSFGMSDLRPVLGFEDNYSVTSDGRLFRTKSHYGTTCCKECKPSELRGYLRFHLCKGNKVRVYSAHRMVWEAFNGRITDGMVINHKNGKKNDNRLSNLEVCTPAENSLHATRELGVGRGSRNGSAILTESDIPLIRQLYASGKTQQAIADLFEVSQIAVSRIIRHANWSHV